VEEAEEDEGEVRVEEGVEEVVEGTNRERVGIPDIRDQEEEVEEEEEEGGVGVEVEVFHKDTMAHHNNRLHQGPYRRWTWGQNLQSEEGGLGVTSSPIAHVKEDIQPPPPPIPPVSSHLLRRWKTAQEGMLGPVQVTDFTQRLKARVGEWYKRTQDHQVIEIIKTGVQYVTQGATRAMTTGQGQACKLDTQSKLLSVYKDYLDRGVLTHKLQGQRPVVLHHFPVAKATDGYRLVTDFRTVNGLGVDPPKFKLLQPKQVQDHIQKGDWMVTVDIKDAYNHLYMQRDMPLTAIEVPSMGTLCWKALGFGLSWAPYMWVRVLRAALKPLRLLGLRLLDYMDDIMLIASTKEEALQGTALLTSHLETLGICLNYPKSSLVPEQEKEFLGFLWNTKEWFMGIPKTKRLKVQGTCIQLARRKRANKLEISSIHGMLQALLPATSQLRSQIREMQQWLTVNQTENYHLRLEMSHPVRMELKWWGQRLKVHIQKDLGQLSSTLHIWTDASDLGWGAHTQEMEKETIQGWFSQEWIPRRIEEKELWTACIALKHYINTRKLSNMTLTVHTDSTVALSYLWDMKGGRKHHLQKHLHGLWKLVHKKKIKVMAEWISTLDNTLADKLSRKKRDHSDYSINMGWLQRIQSKMRVQVTLDGFATLENRRVRRFVSRVPHPKATWVDCLSLKREQLMGEVVWCNPPIKIIPRVLMWILEVTKETSQDFGNKGPVVLLMMPKLQGANWWPLMLRTVKQLMTLRHQEGLFTDYLGRSMPQPVWHSVCGLW